MKFIPVICLSIILLFSFCKHQKGSQSSGTAVKLFSGQVLIQEDYCGGVEPDNDSILHPRPHPAGHVKLYFKNGNSNTGHILDSCETAPNGTFQIALRPGKYCVVEARKKADYKTPKDDQWNTYDTACYRTNYLKCDYELDLKNDNVNNVRIILEHHCPWRMPCVNYHGPLPPTAQKPHNE